jgi:hypothetical protein
VRSTGGGGGGGTIVIDPDGLRRGAALLLEGSEAYRSLGSRLTGTAFPEMPAGVGSVVTAAVTEAGQSLATEAPQLAEWATELRTRALWAEIADRLSAGYDLEGPYLDAFKAGMASGALLRYAEPWQADLARAYAEKLREDEDDGGILGFFKDVGEGIVDFATGAWDAVKDPFVMLYDLTPLNDDWTEKWSALGQGLAYGVTHPVEFGKALIALDALEERGVAYWLGNLAPTVAATILSGGAAAGVRGATTTSRMAATGSRLLTATADGERLLATSSRLKRLLSATGHQFEHDVMRPGVLTPEGASLAELRASAAQTFAGGKYDLVSSSEPYVVFKAGEHPGGRFFSFDPPLGEAQTRIDSAVKPVWTDAHGNYLGSSPLEKGYAFVVENPQHPLPMGPVGNQGGVYLGGPDRIQIYIDDRAASGLRLVEEWPLGDAPDWVREAAGAHR